MGQMDYMFDPNGDGVVVIASRASMFKDPPVI